MSQNGLRRYNAGPDSDRHDVRYNRVRTTPAPLERPARFEKVITCVITHGGTPPDPASETFWNGIFDEGKKFDAQRLPDTLPKAVGMEGSWNLTSKVSEERHEVLTNGNRDERPRRPSEVQLEKEGRKLTRAWLG